MSRISIWIKGRLDDLGVFISVLGLISYCVASYLLETGQNSLLTVSDSVDVVCLGAVIWLFGCVQSLGSNVKR